MNGGSRYIKGIFATFSIIILGFAWMSLFENEAHYFIAILASGLIIFGLKGLAPYYVSRKWILSDAVITSINEVWDEVNLSVYSRMKYYYPEIEYTYTVDGNQYNSSKVSFQVENIWVPELDLWGVEIDRNDVFWNELKESSKIQVYINPSNHQQAVIIRKINSKRRSHYLSFIVGGLIIFFLWVYFAYFFIK